MSAVLKALVWLIMLPIKLIMLPFTVVGAIQKFVVTLLLLLVVVLVVLVGVLLAQG